MKSENQPVSETLLIFCIATVRFLVTIPVSGFLRLSSCYLLLKNYKVSEKKKNPNSLIWHQDLQQPTFTIVYYSLSHNKCSSKNWTTHFSVVACLATSMLILLSLLRKLLPPNIFARSNIYLSKSKLMITSLLKFSISPLLFLEAISFSSKYRESVQFSSVAQSRPTLFDHMDCSMPDLPVHHQLPEFTQTHVHWVGDANQPSHPLGSPSTSTFNLSQLQGFFRWVTSYQVTKVLECQLQHQFLQWIFRTDLGLSWWLRC